MAFNPLYPRPIDLDCFLAGAARHEYVTNPCWGFLRAHQHQRKALESRTHVYGGGSCRRLADPLQASNQAKREARQLVDVRSHVPSAPSARRTVAPPTPRSTRCAPTPPTRGIAACVEVSCPSPPNPTWHVPWHVTEYCAHAGATRRRQVRLRCVAAHGMDTAQQYLFDLNGYVVLKGVLSSSEVATANQVSATSY